MTKYLTVAEAAEHVRRHPVTVRKALEAGEMHGTQRVVGGRWSVQQPCAEAWLEGELCEHKQNVTPIRRPRAS